MGTRKEWDGGMGGGGSRSSRFRAGSAVSSSSTELLTLPALSLSPSQLHPNASFPSKALILF
jgi:hypothetical protein